jgi:hypothetical protein
MSKVIKLKQSDIENIVSNIIKEQSEENAPQNKGAVELQLGIADDGTYYVYRTLDNGQDEVLAHVK